MSLKNKHQESEGNTERWLISYSDFITLLMVLFVILYSMGQIDIQKYKELAQSMHDAFTVGGPSRVVVPAIASSGGSQPNGIPNPIVIPGIPEKPPQAVEVAGQLTEMLARNNLGNSVSVQTNIEGVLISLSEKILFTQGEADLHPEAYPVLDTIARMLGDINNPIRIVGHTDDSQPTDPAYPSNWELSTARATTVARYLMSKGIAPERITVSGRANYQPVFANDTPEHRALNSRADIVVVYNATSNTLISSMINLPASGTATP